METRKIRNTPAPDVPYSREGDALFQALERPGCPVCTVRRDALQRAMDYWQYEGFSDADDRERLVRSQGFCAHHTWQLARMPASFQLALVYQSTLPELIRKLKQRREQLVPAPRGVRRWLRSRWWRDHRRQSAAAPPCPLCRKQQELDERLTTILLSLLASLPFCQRLSQAPGLCLAHFEQTYEHAETSEQRSFLLDCQSLSAQRLQEDLGELLRKHDYRFLQEPRGEEMTSWRRAAAFFVGNAPEL